MLQGGQVVDSVSWGNVVFLCTQVGRALQLYKEGGD